MGNIVNSKDNEYSSHFYDTVQVPSTTSDGGSPCSLTKPDPNFPPLCLPLEEFKGSRCYDMPCYRYKEGQWLQETGDSTPIVLEHGKDLTIITYNVWFDKFYLDKRFDQLIRILQSKDPDVVCLQEVIPEFVKKLKDSNWVQERYSISDDGGFVIPYGVCLLSKLPVKQQRVWSLPTQMGRNCVIAEFNINKKSLYCATVHLESLNLANYREQQLSIISNLLSSAHTAILMGDFNFDSDINYSQHIDKCALAYDLHKPPNEIDNSLVPTTDTLENSNIREYYKGYIDVWSKLRPNEKGYTYDSIVNK